MSPVKEAVMRLVQTLPDDCTIEDFQYHLYVIEKVEAGLREVDAGNTVPHEEAKRRMDEWARSNGLLPP